MWKKLREKQRNRQECTTAAAVVRILGGKFLEVHKKIRQKSRWHENKMNWIEMKTEVIWESQKRK